jgi:hypothetical protein
MPVDLPHDRQVGGTTCYDDRRSKIQLGDTPVPGIPRLTLLLSSIAFCLPADVKKQP